VNFTLIKATFNYIPFGMTQAGYAFRTLGYEKRFNSVILPLRYLSKTTSYASDSNPGFGWIGLGVVLDDSLNYMMYWKNMTNNSFAMHSMSIPKLANSSRINRTARIQCGAIGNRCHTIRDSTISND
jgi:hypothetical protein